MKSTSASPFSARSVLIWSGARGAANWTIHAAASSSDSSSLSRSRGSKICPPKPISNSIRQCFHRANGATLEEERS